MKYICKYFKNCYARGYCFHAREHEKLPVVSGATKIKTCNETHLCGSTETDAICEEVKCPINQQSK
jgi:hypothetical protein